MEQQLFVLLFLTGAVPLVSSIPRKYYLVQQMKTWTEAQTYCRSTHTDLATIDSDADVIKLKTEAETQGFSSGAWIGLYSDIDSWHWSSVNHSLGIFRPWYSGQPDNANGNEECGVVNWEGWFDCPCDILLQFLCYDDQFTNSDRYILYTTTKTFTDAQLYCRQYHTDLASTRSPAELADVQTKARPWTWFGLHRDSWKWSDHTIISSTKWMPAKIANQYCSYLLNNQSAPASCSDLKPFFCHRIITKQQQIIRVMVQLDQLEQEVNNPAIKSAIEEKIKQKLMQRGIETVTVKCREQLDGKVFNKLK